GSVANRRYRMVSSEEQEIVGTILRDFTERTIWRNQFAGQWEETSNLIWPEQRNSFFYGSYSWPGQKKTYQQIDASGMLALHRFAAIADSLLTPANSEWHTLRATNRDLMKNRDIALYFGDLTRILFNYRRNPLANFRGQNNSNFRSLGGFGNATMLV